MNKHQDRGQAFVVDGLFGTILLITAVSIAVITTGYTPTEAQEPETIENKEQVAEQVENAMRVSQQDGSLQVLVLAWNNTKTPNATGYFDIDSGFPTPSGLLTYPATAQRGSEFTSRMRQIEEEYNVDIKTGVYPETNKTQNVTTVVRAGRSQDQITVRRRMVLHKEDSFKSPQRAHDIRSGTIQATAGGMSVSDSDRYPIPPAETTDNVYNIVIVEATIYSD